MPPPFKLFSSTVGTKLLIALTGLAMVGFLVTHLAGNLLVFAGPATFNSYSHKLISNPLIIPAEIGLLGILILHVYKSVSNYVGNRRARPVGYEQKSWAGYPSRKSWASTTMIVSGVILLVFLILHLKTFKYGAWYIAQDQEYRDLYRLVVEVFSSPFYAVFYVISMVVVGMHLWHGFSSAFQSLGVDSPRQTPRLRQLGFLVAVVIAGGFMLIPLWVLLTGGRP